MLKTFADEVDSLWLMPLWLIKVRQHGEWDIKRWEGVSGVKNFIFRGMRLEYDDLGNINYGYTGHAAGLSAETLIYGSIAAARGKDDPKDWFYILAGYAFYP